MCGAPCDLERSATVAISVSNGYVPDVCELTLQLEPELLHLLFAAPEAGKRSLDHVDAGRRMTVLDVAACDRLGAGEYPALIVGEECNRVSLIYERDVHRRGVGDQLNPLSEIRPVSNRRSGPSPGTLGSAEVASACSGPAILAPTISHLASGSTRRLPDLVFRFVYLSPFILREVFFLHRNVPELERGRQQAIVCHCTEHSETVCDQARLWMEFIEEPHVVPRTECFADRR